jgi:uncharacterized protein (DUF1810 family)
MSNSSDYDLSRFVTAQAEVYPAVLAELKRGRKETHWIWFIFPQLAGLGSSAAAKFYAIANLEEARQYLTHPLLGKHLRECCDVLCSLQSSEIADVLGYPDNLKLCSSMTLFECASDDPDEFVCVLQKFYGGKRDPVTQKLLGDLEK